MKQRNYLTTNKLSIFCQLQMSLTIPNLSFHGQRELSTGLQLQQKVQNHTAINHCCLQFLIMLRQNKRVALNHSFTEKLLNLFQLAVSK